MDNELDYRWRTERKAVTKFVTVATAQVTINHFGASQHPYSVSPQLNQGYISSAGFAADKM